MAWKRISATIFSSLIAASVAVGCGDDDGGSDHPDAGNPADAGPDGGTGGPAFTANIILAEQSVPAIPALGDGSLITISFNDVAAAVPASYEQMPGTPFACKAFEYTAAQFVGNVGVDEGTVQLTVPDGPEYPPCNYVDGRGYLCIGAQGSAGVIAVVNAEMALFSLTNDAVTFGADEIGRFVEISGSDVMSNNGRFPIVNATGDHTIVYRNPTPGAAAEDPTAAMYQTLAGAGPSGQDDPLADDDAAEAELTAGGGNDYDSFTSNIANIGDSFTLNTDSQALINDIPLDGSAFTVSCDGAGGTCNTATASVLNITTTDATLPVGLPPYVLPPPTTKAVVVQCIFLSSEATVPAEASAFLMDSGATRLRATYLRLSNVAVTQGNSTATVAAGHGQTGFTTP